MRWPFGPPHLTLKTLQKKQKRETKNKTNKKNQKKERKSKKTQKYPQKELFSYQSKFSSFLGGCPKIAFFDNLAQKMRTQKHYKNRGFQPIFLEKSYASRNGHFWTKKPKFINSSYHFFFFAFFLFQKQKTQKSAETPIFIVF